jgi:hypothetical protein
MIGYILTFLLTFSVAYLIETAHHESISKRRRLPKARTTHRKIP